MIRKTYLITLLLTAGIFTAKAQSTAQVSSDTTAYIAVEHPAEFPGGEIKLQRAINRAVHYPENARINNIQGKVSVSFIIEKDGSVSNAKVVKSLSADTDAEAIRVVSKLPKWKPATQNGEAVRYIYTVQVSFYLG